MSLSKKTIGLVMTRNNDAIVLELYRNNDDSLHHAIKVQP